MGEDGADRVRDSTKDNEVSAQMDTGKILNEVCIHTWKDATLRELTDLVKDVNEDARNIHSKLSFCNVYPNKEGRLTMKELGFVFSNPKKVSGKEDKTLKELNFETGDYVDIAITSPPRGLAMDGRGPMARGMRRGPLRVGDRPPGRYGAMGGRYWDRSERAASHPYRRPGPSGDRAGYGRDGGDSRGKTYGDRGDNGRGRFGEAGRADGDWRASRVQSDDKNTSEDTSAETSETKEPVEKR